MPSEPYLPFRSWIPVLAALNTAYENNEPEAKKYVRKVVGYCLKGFETSLGEIGIGFDSFDFESDLVWKKAADDVLEALKTTPYVFTDEGALIFNSDKIAVDLDLKKRYGMSKYSPPSSTQPASSKVSPPSMEK